VFRLLDKEGLGRICFKGLQKYAAKYGGTPLQDEELQSIFRDFKSTSPSGDDAIISQQEFLVCEGHP
jgi:Ca2+-binding EF-hand superfamily protein